MEQLRYTPETVQKDEEISLKDVILTLQEWIRYLLGKWLIILVFGILGAGIGIACAFVMKPDYVGKLTFVLEDTKSSPLGAYAGIASQFGIDLGGGGGSGIFQGDNILQFLKSRLMVEKVLLTPVSYDNKVTSLADLYIETYKLKKDWSDRPGLEQISFPYDTGRKNFSLLQDSILNVLYKRITKKELSVDKSDKKLSFIEVKCINRNEIFAKSFVEHLVKEATDFYIDLKTKRSRTNVGKLQAKADSILALLNSKTYSAAALQDLNMNPARRVTSVGSEVAGRDKMVLQTVYGEVLKNLEISKMTMDQETPVIQIVDGPILPLEKEKVGKIKAAFIGGILGGILILAVLICKRLYKVIMS